MSFVFTKNKDKRARSPAGENNNSFVKNVTSRVSGLLSAGITKWFSSPSSSGANGSAAITEGTDSSTEDEAPESPSMLQPPAKRIRYSSPRKYMELTTTETTTTSNVITETGSVLYNSIQSPPGRHTFRREPNFASTPIRAHTEDMNMNSTMERTDEENQFTHHTVSAIGQSVSMKRKSLFDSHKQRERSLIACAKTAAHQVKDVKQPHFKPHLLGSPFYPGQTMYGGASASSPHINQNNIKQRKMTYVNSSKDAETVNMSTSSRRIMDLLENYSSPLLEAKRIPRYELSELADINKSLQPNSSSMRNSYKTQELYIPSTASLIRLKARSRLMDSTKAARQFIASHSSTIAPYQPYAIDTAKTDHPDGTDSGPSKSQSKLKSRLTRQNRGDDPYIMPETVELPTAVLQIDKNNLPKFSFGGPVSRPSEKPTNKPISEAFMFSTPLPITTDAKAAVPRPPTFDFGSPERAADNTSPPKFSFGTQTSEEVTKPKEEPPKAVTESVIAFAKVSNDWKCPECWVSNKPHLSHCACCGFRRPSQQPAATASAHAPKCTTCKLSNSQPNSGKCVNCEQVQASPQPMNSLPAGKEAISSKWNCNDCWVKNDESAVSCICCGSRKPQGAPAATAPEPAVPLSAEKKDWRCGDCFITNKPNIAKCVACSGVKPGTKPAPKTLPSIASTNFFTGSNTKMQDIIKVQKACWECPVCLASNAEDKLNCLCCNAERHQNQKDKEATQDNAKTNFTNFKFSAEVNAGFKFGIDPKVQQTNLSKTSKPKSTEESETNNNIITITPSYTEFTLPPKKQNDSIDGSKTDEPKPSFSFGIPKQNTTPATGFVPIMAPDAQLPDIVKPSEDKEKPQEVPSISFKAPETANPTGLLASPLPTDNPQNAMNAFLNNSNFNKVIETKKSVSPKKPAAQPSAMIDASKPQFSFSAGAAKPSTDGMFDLSAPTNSASPAAPVPAPIMFKNSETNVAPALSFFAKPETTSVPSTTPFQNNVQSTPAGPTSATSLFSFGNNQSTNPAPATETKGFNFSFGSASSAAFGSTTSAPAFGSTASAPSFGITTSAPTFGSATSASTFGSTTSAPTFGSTTSVPAFGSTSTAPTFGATTSVPAFGANSSAPTFGSASTAPTFGATTSAPTFGSTTTVPAFGSTASTPAFGAALQPSSTFNLPAANPLTNGPTNPLGGNGVANPLARSITGNGIAPSGNGILGAGSATMFNAPANETTNMWPTATEQPNQANPFMANAAPKEPFTFGSTTTASPFGSQANAPVKDAFTFGATSSPSPFGAPSNVFGASSPPAQSMFGTSQPTMFGGPAASQPTPMFGNAQPSNPAPAAPIFGATGLTPFGASGAPMATFEAPQVPAPTFNFGATQPGVFGFCQQPQSQMQQPPMQGLQQSGMYNFSGAASTGAMQFNMGSAPSPSAGSRRLVRKAVRRNLQR